MFPTILDIRREPIPEASQHVVVRAVKIARDKFFTRGDVVAKYHAAIVRGTDKEMNEATVAPPSKAELEELRAALLNTDHTIQISSLTHLVTRFGWMDKDSRNTINLFSPFILNAEYARNDAERLGRHDMYVLAVLCSYMTAMAYILRDCTLSGTQRLPPPRNFAERMLFGGRLVFRRPRGGDGETNWENKWTFLECGIDKEDGTGPSTLAHEEICRILASGEDMVPLPFLAVLRMGETLAADAATCLTRNGSDDEIKEVEGEYEWVTVCGGVR